MSTDLWLDVILAVLGVVFVVGGPVLAVTEHRRERREEPLRPLDRGVADWQDHTVAVPGIDEVPNGFVGDTNPDWAWTVDPTVTWAGRPVQGGRPVPPYRATTAISRPIPSPHRTVFTVPVRRQAVA